MTLMTRTSISLLIVIALATSCQQKQQAKNKNIEIAAMHDSIAVIPFELEGGGSWGFKINVGHKTFIYQDIIPTLAGRHYFQSKEDAQKVGDLMMSKMRSNGKSFPIISKQELLDMKIAGVQ
jgi:hypothetical protein